MNVTYDFTTFKSFEEFNTCLNDLKPWGDHRDHCSSTSILKREQCEGIKQFQCLIHARNSAVQCTSTSSNEISYICKTLRVNETNTLSERINTVKKTKQWFRTQFNTKIEYNSHLRTFNHLYSSIHHCENK